MTEKGKIIEGLQYAWRYIKERPNPIATPKARAMHSIMQAIVCMSWHDAKLDPPPCSDRVLCVKLPKNGNKDLCFGAWYPPDDLYPEGHWTTSGSCNNVIFWMPLPEIPGVGDDVITESGWVNGSSH